MAASLAESWRTRHDDFRGGCNLCYLEAFHFGTHSEQCGAYCIRREFARAGQLSAEFAVDDAVAVEFAAHLLLDERLSLLYYHERVSLVNQLGDKACRQRVL